MLHVHRTRVEPGLVHHKALVEARAVIHEAIREVRRVMNNPVREAVTLTKQIRAAGSAHGAACRKVAHPWLRPTVVACLLSGFAELPEDAAFLVRMVVVVPAWFWSVRVSRHAPGCLASGLIARPGVVFAVIPMGMPMAPPGIAVTAMDDHDTWRNVNASSTADITATNISATT